ncbi:MAG TPA: arginine--tRNA ligase [Phycisphaerae bacterium]|nr:arginine--tRNA ligase [Phycisphaerae bacterium]
MTNVQRTLDDRLTAAIRAAFPDAADAPAIVMQAQDERFGDYQANGAMALAKRLGKKPRDVAAEIVAKADLAGIAETPEIAGPGFINITLSPDWLAARLAEMLTDQRLGVPSPAERQTIVVDYSAPNLAKEMHVGHLRSTIIGDALVRVLEFLGHTVIRQNHVGDWGTQIGMLVAYIEREGLIQPVEDWQEAFFSDKVLDDLEALYRESKQMFDADDEFAREARETVVRLQGGDERTLNIWHCFLVVSVGHCRKVYERLGVLLTNDDIRGESAYNDVLPGIVEALTARGLLSESEGAQCVFLDEFKAKDGSPLPLIVQKSDEGYLYATTDLAAIAFRTGNLPETANPSSEIRNPKSPRAKRVLYVVDARQSLHFRMVFAVARAAGFASEDVSLEHVGFGMMLGPDSRPFKTREGGTVKLMDLIDEAEKRARTLLEEKQAELPEDQRTVSDTDKPEIARIVGIGALKYADLAQNRTKDYVFSWDKMLSLDGNTAPYMQYAFARIHSIARKGGLDLAEVAREPTPGEAFSLAEPAERRLAVALLQFPETVEAVAAECLPHVLCGYLYRLAGAFMGFYETCPVLKAEEPVRTSRLRLCALTAKVIEKGLGLLGIETAERM